MTRRRGIFAVGICLAVMIGVAGVRAVGHIAQADPTREHDAWVLESLAKMETIKPGMTRADLLKVFHGEGGIHTPTQRSYVFSECPYFKVTVVFTPASSGTPMHESPADVIDSISRPYIERGVAN